MRILWKLLKVALAAAILIPLGMVVLAVAFGVLGTVLGLALVAIKLACLGLVAYGVYRVVRMFFAPRSPASAPMPAQKLAPPSDPYYEAAMRELDAEIERR